MNEKLPIVPIVIDNDYSSFHEFYSKEKRVIYKKIIDVFEEILKENIKEKKLLVIARIDGVSFDTDFQIDRDNKKLLTDVIIPYFEEIEEYELCSKIITIISELNKINQ
jgi:hypothetical protein